MCGSVGWWRMSCSAGKPCSLPTRSDARCKGAYSGQPKTGGRLRASGMPRPPHKIFQTPSPPRSRAGSGTPGSRRQRGRAGDAMMAASRQTFLLSQSTPAAQQLQRKCACCKSANGGMCEESKSKGMQRKLAVGSSSDPLEHEADRVADQVMASSPHDDVADAPGRVQRFSGATSNATDVAPASVERTLGGSGRPLEPGLRNRHGAAFRPRLLRRAGPFRRGCRTVGARRQRPRLYLQGTASCSAPENSRPVHEGPPAAGARADPRGAADRQLQSRQENLARGRRGGGAKAHR